MKEYRVIAVVYGDVELETKTLNVLADKGFKLHTVVPRYDQRDKSYTKYIMERDVSTPRCKESKGLLWNEKNAELFFAGRIAGEKGTLTSAILLHNAAYMAGYEEALTQLNRKRK